MSLGVWGIAEGLDCSGWGAGRFVFGDRALFQKWATTGYIDFLEIYAGLGELLKAMSRRGFDVGEGGLDWVCLLYPCPSPRYS